MVLSSVQFSHSVMSSSLQPHGLQHARPPCPSPTPGIYSDSYPLSWWCHPASSSPSSPAFNLSQHQVFFSESVLLISGQSIGVSASASVLLVNIQGWFSLGWTGLISLKSKGLSRVFSSTTNSKGSILHHSAFLLPNKPPYLREDPAGGTWL